MSDVIEDDWHGLYDGSTSRDDLLFTPESVSHPAKGSIPLFRRIFAELAALGWLRNGQCVVDCFGGRGTTAALWVSLHPDNAAVTVEVEGHFVAMQRTNLTHAERKLGRSLKWQIWRGDSRQADALLAGDFASTRALVEREQEALFVEWRNSEQRDTCKTLEQYANAVGTPWALEYWPDLELGEGAACVTSPPWGMDNTGGPLTQQGGECRREEYGSSPAQIGNLPSPDVMVTSPPYGQGVIGQSNEKQVERLRALTEDPTSSLHGRNPEGAWFKAVANGYRCEAAANIERCPDVAVGSPPYADSLGSGDPETKGGLFRDPKRRNDRTLNAGYQQPQAVVTSPPYADSVNATQHGIDWEKAGPATGNRKRGVGTKHEETFRAQLGYQQPHVAVSSQPFEAQSGGHGPSPMGPLADPALHARHAASNRGIAYQAMVGSPPFEGVVATGDPNFLTSGEQSKRIPSKSNLPSNGDSSQQIGSTQGEDYAAACGAVYAALARAGVRYCVTVTKNPTAQGKLKDLDGLTERLLEAAGYRVVKQVRAWLFETDEQRNARMGQAGLFEDVAPSQKPKGRLSFFKRLHMARGGVAAQWEMVLFSELVMAPEGEGPVACTSPPYGDMQAHPSLGSVNNDGWGAQGGDIVKRRGLTKDYGNSPAQIGRLPDRTEALP